MLYNTKVLYFLLLLYFLFKLVFTFDSCGEPALYKLTTFKVVNNSNINSSNSNQQYSNRTVIKYECIDKNDEIIQGEKKNRTCENGKWSENIPRCAQSLKNKVVVNKFEVYDHLSNKSVNITGFKSIKSNQYPIYAFHAKPYWPQDCENVTISHCKNQYLIIRLNTSVTFNFFKLTLYYPEINHSMINETNITITSIIDSSKICELTNRQTYVSSNQIVDTISVLCKLSEHIIANNSITKDYKLKLLNKPSSQIKLKFDLNKNHSSNGLKISICELRLFTYQINDCGQPDKPLHSVVTSNGEFTQFSCEDGFDIHPLRSSGYHVRCDLNSEWNDKFPICLEKMYCYLPENKTDSSPLITFDSSQFKIIDGKNTTTSGTEATYSCENITINGTETELSPRNASMRRCRRGKWSGPEPKCVIPKNNNIFKFGSHFNYKTILIIMGCALLLCFIIILSFIIVSLYKRNKNEITMGHLVTRGGPSSDGELWDNPDRYDSIRMSQLTHYEHYEHFYEDVDNNSQGMANNVIYESDATNLTNNLQINGLSNILSTSNSTYC